MVIDYKGVTFSFKDKRRKQLLRRFRLALAILLLAAIALIFKFFMDARELGVIQDILLAGNTQKAAEALPRSSGFLFHPSSWQELKALVLLCQGRKEEATGIFAAIAGRGGAIDHERFLALFSDRAEYLSMKLYVNFLEKQGFLQPFYHAMSRSALFDAPGSDALLNRLPENEAKKHAAELPLLRDINRQLRAGRIEYILDSNDKPLAYYDVKKNLTVSLTPGLRMDAFNEEFRNSIRFYSLTVDLDVQQQLHQLFTSQKYRGSFLLLNLNDSSIEAAYSTHAPGDWDSGENAVFSQTYEPGSIIKVITLLAWLRSKSPNIFPFQCKGMTPIKQEIFYDWLKHDHIASCEEALAVSCNLSFAQMGMNLGFRELRDMLDKFYFNSKGFNDLFIHFKTGGYDPRTGAGLEMANLSVGLNRTSITTFHAAFIAAAVARSGAIYAPTIIKNKKNLLRLGYYQREQKLLNILQDNVAFMKVKNAMIQVVENPRGTGRRSRVEGMKTAVKTGTAGDRDDGLDAILIGFFPAEKPRYAFAFRLEKVGKAELKGAVFLQDFLIGFNKK